MRPLPGLVRTVVAVARGKWRGYRCAKGERRTQRSTRRCGVTSRNRHEMRRGSANRHSTPGLTSHLTHPQQQSITHRHRPCTTQGETLYLQSLSAVHRFPTRRPGRPQRALPQRIVRLRADTSQQLQHDHVRERHSSTEATSAERTNFRHDGCRR